MEVTPEEIVSAIGQLDRKRLYPYARTSNKNMIRIVDVALPCGPIRAERVGPKVNGRRRTKKEISISANSIATLAAALSRGRPVSVEAVFFGSGSSRSVLESLVVHSPNGFLVPMAVETGDGRKRSVVRKVKHTAWLKEVSHPPGVIGRLESGSLVLEPDVEGELPAAAETETVLPADSSLTRHAQVQEALILFGSKLGAPVWIARNDHGISGGLGRLGDREGVLKAAELADVPFLRGKEAMDSITHVDCAWLTPDRYMLEAAFEIEHSTGITSGLTRLQRLWFAMPESIRPRVRWTIVAADSDRDKACQIARREQFRALDAWFLPYSGVEDFRQLCLRRGMKGASCEFLENFMARAREG